MIIAFSGSDGVGKTSISGVLNKLYSFFETISCKYANKTISVTKRAEDARIKKHKLKKESGILFIMTHVYKVLNIV